MGSLSQPSSPLSVNPGVSQETDATKIPDLRARAGISQIRGVTVNGSTGAGIPKAVTDVKASVSNASTGVTSVIKVLFNRDPSDTAFASVNIYAKGYQGNQTPVLVGSSTDSPATFVLNNTGEALSLIVQAQGNGGATPLASCPSVGAQLPKSTAGGVGTSTSTANTNLTGDVIATAGVASVVKVQGIAVASGTPVEADSFRYNSANKDWERSMMREWGIFGTGVAIPVFGESYPWGAGVASTSNFGSIGTAAAQTSTSQPFSTKYSTSTAAGIQSAGWNLNPVNTAPFAAVRRARFGILLNQTTQSRIWFGFSNSPNLTNFQADNPNISFAGFRYSTNAGDTKWMCYCSTSNVAFTATAESGSHLDTGFHIFDVIYTTTSVAFYIDGTLVGTVTTNIPASTTSANVIAVIDNVASAVAKSFQFFFARGTANPSFV